jgi:hypothetical protein
MKGKRIFDRFGFNLPKIEKQKSTLRLLNEPYKEWRFKYSKADWLEVEGEQVLCNYEPPIELRWILQNQIEISTG